MKWSSPSVLVVPLALLAAARAPAAQTGGGVVQVVCVGTACGGGGGSGNPCVGSQFCYRVKPNGRSITYLEVGVEDGNPLHYADLCAPTGWDMEIVWSARAHDVDATAHGAVTGKAGTCPWTLRFFGPAQSANFELGYSYMGNPSTVRHHDTAWKTSGGGQSSWTMPLGSANGPVHAPVPLNVLVIVLDDVGCDKLSLYDGNVAPPYAPIPRLTALAADGIRFRSYYSQPVCSPARACLLTGRHALRTGMSTNSEAYALPYDELLLSELLAHGFPQGMAYASGAFGKWHLGQYDPGHAVGNGFDIFRGTLSNTVVYDATTVGDHFNWALIEHQAGDPPPTGLIPMTTWVAESTRIDATAWIAANDGPFFAWVAFNPPHVPAQVPPTFTEDGRRLLTDETLALLATSGSQPCDGDGANEGDKADADCTDQVELFYRAALEAVDAEIGYLIDDLSPVKRANTMIFVIGDNGTPAPSILPPHDPTHHKGGFYQGGVHVPLIVSGPLTPPGATLCDRPVSAVDLWSTVADITGADRLTAYANLHPGPPSLPNPLPELDSTSFFPLILDPAAPATIPWAFSQLFKPPGPYASVTTLSEHRRCITDGAYKYIRALPEGATQYTHQFYDVLGDPEEAQDLWRANAGDWADPAEYALYLVLRGALEGLSEL
jgi:arylsulfatase A-like enzyme